VLVRSTLVLTASIQLKVPSVTSAVEEAKTIMKIGLHEVSLMGGGYLHG